MLLSTSATGPTQITCRPVPLDASTRCIAGTRLRKWSVLVASKVQYQWRRRSSFLVPPEAAWPPKAQVRADRLSNRSVGNDLRSHSRISRGLVSLPVAVGPTMTAGWLATPGHVLGPSVGHSLTGGRRHCKAISLLCAVLHYRNHEDFLLAFSLLQLQPGLSRPSPPDNGGGRQDFQQGSSATRQRRMTAAALSPSSLELFPVSRPHASACDFLY